MNDTIIMENYLLILKSNVEVFVHGTLESSYTDIQTLLNKCLNETINCQRDTYISLLDMGAYNVEKIDATKINKVIKKLNK